MIRGILYVIIASLAFGVAPLGNKYVLLSGMAPDCTLFYQTLTMVGGTALVILLTRTSFRVPLKDALFLLLEGVVGIGATDYLLNLAYGYLQVSTVIMLQFLYPTIVLLISALFFGQRVSRLTAGAVVLSITGLVLVTDFSGGMDPLGVLFALGSAAAYAFFVLANDYGRVNRHPLVLKLFYLSVGAALVCGGKTAASASFSLPADGKTALVLVGVVGVGSLLGFFFITAGVKAVGASKSAFLNMLEPITSVLGGVLLYQEVLGLRGWTGCFCVLLSVLLLVLDGNDGEEERTFPAGG